MCTTNELVGRTLYPALMHDIDCDPEQMFATRDMTANPFDIASWRRGRDPELGKPENTACCGGGWRMRLPRPELLA